LIITSAKKSFLAGGDLDYLHHNQSAQAIFQHSQFLQKIYRDLERPGVPVVAAINGNALGTGFELALACHHRVVVDRPDIRLGLPEVTLGLMPGNGGVIRLMWLLGIEGAFPILSSGQRFRPRPAFKAGIIDELAESEAEMLEKAKNWLRKTREGRRRWDTEEGGIPGGSARDPKVGEIIQGFTAQLSREANHNYPAPRAILKTLVDGSKVDFDTACRIESRHFAELLLRKETKNMTKTFWYDFNAIKSGEMRPKGFGKFRPKRVGIIGAGMMGSGIAVACLLNGLKVVLKDVSKSIAERGKENVARQLGFKVKEELIREEDKRQLLQRIQTTETSADFQDCDIVLEAVFENANVKNKVTKEAEAYMDEYALFASNTVSIPITELAEASVRPENYVGLHFFVPVEQVPMVEVVRGKKTSEETIARAFDFVRAIRKIPIIVKDTWGFYISRVQNTYILEGIQMLAEGYSPALIENVGIQLGMPKGALALADDLSLDMVLTYENQAAKQYGNKYIEHPAANVLQQMLDEHQRPGRKKRAGFYEYSPTGRQLWGDLAIHYPNSKQTFELDELRERFLFAQVIEAVWCLQEGIIHSIAEANLGSIYGWGFPAYKGGVLQFVNDYGLEAFIDRCRHYEKLHGPRFKVPSLLHKKAKKGLLSS
ncbi:MAG: 3-hydroxyacyl-CoA dehydrogenase NAD-binding domain-containing protein, partial [Bacteroidota bacterium]